MSPSRLWPAAVVAVLVVTVAANGVLLWAAHHGDAPAIEPDYYRKAVAWDSTLAARRASAALGWRADAVLGPLAAGGAEVGVVLTDAAGAPLEGAHVRVTAVHNARGGRTVEAVLAPRGAGRYAARAPLGRAGLWELRIEAARGAERFAVSLRRDARPAGRP
uniref:FixH family protein n=1 Tax=Eiseniibacteriota bacterium TaxID=2212470 RepID=A0A832MKV0_UNCEI